MSLSTDMRANAIFAAIKAANPNFSKLSGGDAPDVPPPDTEAAALLSNLKTVFGADLNYLIANTVVQPATMQAPAGATVSTTGSPSAQTGATTSSVAITGTGTIS